MNENNIPTAKVELPEEVVVTPLEEAHLGSLISRVHAEVATVFGEEVSHDREVEDATIALGLALAKVTFDVDAALGQAMQALFGALLGPEEDPHQADEPVETEEVPAEEVEADSLLVEDEDFDWLYAPVGYY